MEIRNAFPADSLRFLVHTLPPQSRVERDSAEAAGGVRVGRVRRSRARDRTLKLSVRRRDGKPIKDRRRVMLRAIGLKVTSVLEGWLTLQPQLVEPTVLRWAFSDVSPASIAPAFPIC